MTLRIGVIGGTGLYELIGVTQQKLVQTPFGAVTVSIGDVNGREAAFLPRHGPSHSIPPHAINYEANMTALMKLGAKAVIGVNAVGALNPKLMAGDYVIPSQFIDFTKSRHTVFDREVRHVNMYNPYCEVMRTYLRDALQGTRLHDVGMYVCVEGPRFETEAEILMFAKLGGDVIGMTTAHEATIARELNMCYASVALVTNEAFHAEPSHDEVLRLFVSKKREIDRVLTHLMLRIPQRWTCSCQKR